MLNLLTKVLHLPGITTDKRILSDCSTYIMYLVNVVLFLHGEAEDVVGLVGKLHVLLVVDAIHSHLALEVDILHEINSICCEINFLFFSFFLIDILV